MNHLKNLVTGMLFTITVGAISTPALAQDDTSSTPSSFSTTQVTDIQKIVHDYLVQHPEVLVEASQALQSQMEAKQQQSAMSGIQQNISAIFKDPASPFVGNANGDVTIVEFFDYQCGHCKAMAQPLQSLEKQNPNVKFIFKEFPIFGENSDFAARAALASVKQGKFAAYHQALLVANNPLNPTKILQVAKSVGLNVDKLKKDMKDPEVAKALKDNLALAKTLQLAGTPTFIVANKALTQFKFIPGATSQDDLQNTINNLK